MDVHKPKVSIIILNWNHPRITAKCLDSLRKITYKDYEIILIDNGSKDESVLFLSQNYPEVTLIQNKKNEGFARGCNIGMRRATGDYFLLLNNDTEVTPEFLNTLVEALETDSRIAAVSPRILSYGAPVKVQYAGFPVTNRFTGRVKVKHAVSLDAPALTEETASTHGAAMLISRKATEDIGLFCEDFFAYYEEVDWCYRARKRGYRLLCVNGCVISHIGSSTAGGVKVRLMTRNRILFMRRNFDFFSVLVFYLYFVACAIPYHALKMLFSGQKNLLKPFLSGALEGFTKRNVNMNQYMGDC